MEKILVAFYSRSGKTKKVAETISDILKCDIEEIFDTKDRGGVTGFLRAGNEAVTKRFTVIKELKKNPSLYDLVIIGTPIWAGNVSVPIRTYLSLHREDFKDVAFFSTCLGSDADKVFKDMENICQKPPLALLKLTSREVNRNQYLLKVKEFISNLKEKLKK